MSVKMNNGLLCATSVNGLSKDVGAKIFQSIHIFKFLPQSDNELLPPEMTVGGHRLPSSDKCGKLP